MEKKKIYVRYWGGRDKYYVTTIHSKTEIINDENPYLSRIDGIDCMSDGQYERLDKIIQFNNVKEALDYLKEFHPEFLPEVDIGL